MQGVGQRDLGVVCLVQEQKSLSLEVGLPCVQGCPGHKNAGSGGTWMFWSNKEYWVSLWMNRLSDSLPLCLDLFSWNSLWMIDWVTQAVQNLERMCPDG